MKCFVDGDKLVITRDDFVDLQTSPALFYPLESDIAKAVLEVDSLIGLPFGDFLRIHSLLSTMQYDKNSVTISGFGRGVCGAKGLEPCADSCMGIIEEKELEVRECVASPEWNKVMQTLGWLNEVYHSCNREDGLNIALSNLMDAYDHWLN